MSPSSCLWPRSLSSTQRWSKRAQSGQRLNERQSSGSTDTERRDLRAKRLPCGIPGRWDPCRGVGSRSLGRWDPYRCVGSRSLGRWGPRRCPVVRDPCGLLVECRLMERAWTLVNMGRASGRPRQAGPSRASHTRSASRAALVVAIFGNAYEDSVVVPNLASTPRVRTDQRRS